MTRNSLFLLLVVMAASACSLSPHKVIEVDSRVTANRESGLACCFRKVNQHMHNKLMVVDDLVGLSGGAKYRRPVF